MIRRLLLLLLLLAAAAPLARGDQSDSPRFLIESIDVRGLVHASPDIVRSETRLRTGKAYSEDELRDANDRVNRLPFVLDAQFSLEKGSVRDAYVLVITVNESRRFFYVFDFTLLGGPNRLVGGVSDNGAAVGIRTFVGRSGALHLGLTSNQEYISSRAVHTGAVEAGYTRYNLFGTNAFATINLSLPLIDSTTDGHTGHSRVLPELVVGIPIAANQTVTASITTSDIYQTNPQSVVEDTGLVADRYARRAVRLTWSHNTTDHPFFPTRGTILAVGPLFAWDDDVYNRFNFAAQQGYVAVEHTHTRAVSFEAAHYVPLNERNTVYVRGYGELRSTSGRVSFVDGSQPLSDRRTYVATAAFSHSLWSPERVAVDGDQRLEASLRYQHRGDEYQTNSQRDTKSLDVNWVRRHAWGSLRVGVGYAW